MMSGQFCTFAMILLLLNVLLNVISEDDDDKDGKDNYIKKTMTLIVTLAIGAHLKMPKCDSSVFQFFFL